MTTTTTSETHRSDTHATPESQASDKDHKDGTISTSSSLVSSSSHVGPG